LLCGAGPSLRESAGEIRKLARNRNKFFTIGMNRAITSIDLDYYHIADRRGDRDWTNSKRDYRNTTLIASTVVASQHPPMFKDRYWGEHFFMAAPDTGLTRLSTEMCITACDTLHAAYKLGASEVWLYGCDFSMSGYVEDDKAGGGKTCVLDMYYHDVSAQDGMAIREHIFPTKPPVIGRGGVLVFVTWELVCYAAYFATMAYAVENYGRTPVFNKTPVGILDESWHRPEVESGNDVPEPVPVCPAQAGGPE
jgi:hypothetical protein